MVGCRVSAKRLKEDTFSWVPPLDQAKTALRPEALQQLLVGVDLRSPRLRPWFEQQQKQDFLFFYRGCATSWCMQFTEENFRKLEAENRALKQRVDWLVRKIFGSSPEKVDPNQLLMKFGTETAVPGMPEAPLEAEEVTRVHKRKKKVRVMDQLPKDLLVVIEQIDPEEVKENPDLYRKISEEVFDQLDITPAKVFIRRTVRNKYVRMDDKELPPVVAPAPKRIIDNSYASSGLLLHILISKYADHLPLYRQVQIFKTRYDVALDRDTMSRWTVLLSQMLAQIYEAMRSELRSKSYLQIDETPVRYLNPGNGKCGKGYLWVYNAPRDTVVFEWHTSRGQSCPDGILKDFICVIQSDGYQAYEGC